MALGYQSLGAPTWPNPCPPRRWAHRSQASASTASGVTSVVTHCQPSPCVQAVGSPKRSILVPSFTFSNSAPRSASQIPDCSQPSRQARTG